MIFVKLVMAFCTIVSASGCSSQNEPELVVTESPSKTSSENPKEATESQSKTSKNSHEAQEATKSPSKSSKTPQEPTTTAARSYITTHGV